MKALVARSLRWLPSKSKLYSSGVKLAGGAVLSQVLLAAAMPLLTRIYAPADFGDLAIFSSLYTVLIGIFTLKFDLCILLPKDRDEAIRVSTLALATSAIFSVVLFGAIAVVAATRVSIISWQYFLLPATLFAGAISSVGQQWCSRRKLFHYIGGALVLSSVGNLLLSALLGLAGIPQGGLVLGYTFGTAIGATYLVARMRDAFSEMPLSTLTIGWATVVEYRRFPLHVLPSTLLTVATFMVLPILMTSIFPRDSIGFYSVANRLLTLPSIILGAAVADVFRSDLVTRLNTSNDVKHFFDRTFLWTFAISAPAFALIWLTAPTLLSAVLGAEYRIAGEYARYLCPAALCAMLVQCMAYTFIALHATSRGIVLQALLCCASLGGFWIGALEGNMDRALLLMSLASTGASLVFMHSARSLIVRHDAGRGIET